MMETNEFWLQDHDNAEQLHKLFIGIMEGKTKIVGTTYDEDVVMVTTEEA